jgi:beta-lactamase class A
VANQNPLVRQIEEIQTRAGALAVGVAFHDYESGEDWTYAGERWFHAASTIKVPILLGVFAAVADGVLLARSPVHVRNRFLSVVDGQPYRIEAARDSNPEVHEAVGRAMRVRDLARHMIATSSNLATNVLIDVVGLGRIQEALRRFGITGVELHRGVEDLPAWERGINNRVTPEGLLSVLRAIHDAAHLPDELHQEMLDILHAQEFKSGIPAGLPDGAKVAHKTGEISTVAHDAGIVFLPDREPYAIAILTEWKPEGGSRKETIASLSRVVYEHIVNGAAAAAS